MKRRLLSLFLVLSLALSLVMIPASADDGTPQPLQASTVQAVYLGVQDYGTVTSKDKSNFTHLFSVDGSVQRYRVDDADNYALQNQLAEGYVYDITVEDGTVTQVQAAQAAAQGEITAADENSITVDGKQISLEGASIYRITSQAGGSQVDSAEAAELTVGETVKVYGDSNPTIYLTFVAQDYEAPIDGQAGVRTLKNFLATALEPAGTALYVYGGSWDWQDVGSSAQSTTIGIPQTWIDFFQNQDANYTFKNSGDPAHSYYPHKAWNQYYFAGVDCSAYVAWVTYNVMNTQSGNDGYVMSSTKMAQTFAQTYNFGTWTREFSSSRDFKPGDIFSMKGHVWICLGVCEDGSMVILHSTPSDSKTGQPGGGIQLSGVGESEDCQAVALAQTYMSRYYPQWSERYDAAFKSYEDYTSFTDTSAGKFSWNLDSSGLEDPDGYTNMSAAEILADLFGENQSSGGSSSSSGASIQTSGQGSVEINPTSPKKGDVVTLKPVPRTGYRLDSLKVLDRSGKEVPVTKQADGPFTYTQPAGRVTVKAVFVAATAADIFDDVASNAWYAQSVDYVLDRGLMAGTSANTFSPEMPTSRGMLVTILYSLAGKPQTNAVSFSDVDSNAWYAQAVAWAASKNIVAGYDNGTFGPNDPLTREQTAAILYRFAQVQGLDTNASTSLSGFSDQDDVQEWALPAMEWAVTSGLISGTDLGTLMPQAGASRAQMAVILMNFCQQMDK